MVLYFAIITNDNVWSYVYTFTNGAVVANDTIFAYMGESPYFGIWSYVGGFNDCGWVGIEHILIEAFDNLFIIEAF
jgi:hypothetical protein